MLPPKTLPVKFTVPPAVLFAPLLSPAPPPVAFPVILNTPVDALFAPYAVLLLKEPPPTTFPVIFNVPIEELFAPIDVWPGSLAAEQFPVMFSVPEEVFAAATAPFTVPPVQFPTIYPTAGEAAVNWTTLRLVVVDLAVTLAVSVTPSLSVKMPVPALETSSQVVLTSMVIVCPVLARASSPTVGTTPPVHVAPAEKLPLAAEVMRAMA
jgi:hypothetical protein